MALFCEGLSFELDLLSGSNKRRFHFSVSDPYQHAVVVVAVQVHAERRVVGVRLQDRLDGRHGRRHKQRVHRFTCRKNKKTTTTTLSLKNQPFK